MIVLGLSPSTTSTHSRPPQTPPSVRNTHSTRRRMVPLLTRGHPSTARRADRMKDPPAAWRCSVVQSGLCIILCGGCTAARRAEAAARHSNRIAAMDKAKSNCMQQIQTFSCFGAEKSTWDKVVQGNFLRFPKKLFASGPALFVTLQIGRTTKLQALLCFNCALGGYTPICACVHSMSGVQDEDSDEDQEKAEGDEEEGDDDEDDEEDGDEDGDDNAAKVSACVACTLRTAGPPTYIYIFFTSVFARCSHARGCNCMRRRMRGLVMMATTTTTTRKRQPTMTRKRRRRTRRRTRRRAVREWRNIRITTKFLVVMLRLTMKRCFFV